MRWHAELIAEVILFVLLWRKSCPRAFGVLVGLDLALSLAQLIPYRSGYRAIPQYIEHFGGAAFCVLIVPALFELSDLPHTRANWWHQRILPLWLCSVALCWRLQIGASQSTLVNVNHGLLAAQMACFIAWIALFLGT